MTEAIVAFFSSLAIAMGNIDSFYLLVVGCLVFFMQAGFGMLEAGTVRAKNTKNILLKNMLDACIGAIIWWGWGYGIAYDTSENGFIGSPDKSVFAKNYNVPDNGAM